MAPKNSAKWSEAWRLSTLLTSGSGYWRYRFIVSLLEFTGESMSTFDVIGSQKQSEAALLAAELTDGLDDGAMNEPFALNEVQQRDHTPEYQTTRNGAWIHENVVARAIAKKMTRIKLVQGLHLCSNVRPKR